jgi:hypothetical protein
MKIKTTEEIENMWDSQIGNPPYPLEGKKWVAIDDLLEFMQKLIDDEKKRCGEANAVTCWYQLKALLEKNNETIKKTN